jgi:autotransporter-associated beta strand protein
VDTSLGGGSQFITEDNGLSAFNLSAGAGDVTLAVTAGAVSDTDFDEDIVANAATITLSDPTAADFGSQANPIQTSVDSLTVDTSAGKGSQFVFEASGLDGLNLNAGTGNVTLDLALGGVSDPDTFGDVTASAAGIELLDTFHQNALGSSAHPIGTSVNSLTTLTDGDQFIKEANGLTAFDLNATNSVLFPSGNITLVVAAGAVLDADSGTRDITCNAAVVTLQSATPQSFGTAANPINTAVISLAVNTSAGGGSQFITEANRLQDIELNAGAGNVTLVLQFGALVASAPAITASTASVTLLDTTAKDFGDSANPIITNVGSISVNTAAGGGNIFLSEFDSTTVTSLDAGTGSITLVSGTFNLAAGNALGDNSTLVVNSPAVVNLGSSDETVGSLAGSGTVAFKADGANHVLTVGGDNATSTFSGNLAGNDLHNGSPTDTFDKIGSGTLTLAGNNAFTGSYLAGQGTLLVSGIIATSDASVLALGGGAVLAGGGTINRNVFIEDGGHLAPGSSPGALSTGSLAFRAGATFDVEITGAATGSFDQANVTGVVSIATTGAGVALNLSKFGTLDLHDGDELILIKNDGDGATGDAVTGTFKGLPEGTNLGSSFLASFSSNPPFNGTGFTAKISYHGGDGNDVSIKLSPGSLHPWHNDAPGFANDTSGAGTIQPDGHISAGDVLQIINYINAKGSGPIPDNAVIGQPSGFIDTDQDNQVTASDVISVINFINAHPGQSEGEGGSTNSTAAAAGATQLMSPSDALLFLLATDIASQASPRRSLRL